MDCLHVCVRAKKFHACLAGVAPSQNLGDASENRMSLVNGDKARVNRLRRKKIQLRLRTRELATTAAKPADKKVSSE